MRRTTPQLLILGIDGGTLDLIDPLVAEGVMPNLAGLMADGVHGETRTTWPAHTAPGWSTLVSARQPGGHGVYQFFDLQDPGYGDRLLGTADFGCDTLWEWLAAQDVSAGLMNVPMSHPPRDLPGYQLTWPLTRTLRYSSPPDLLGELARAGAPFAPDIALMYQGDPGYLDTALDNVRARGRTFQHMLRTRPVSVAMAVITEIDRICHHYWHLCDPGHPAHTTPEDPRWGQAIRLTYAAIDEVIGELLDTVDQETAVLVVSDHGFGPGRHNLSLNTLLEEHGLLATRPGAPEEGAAGWFGADGRAVDFTATRAYMPAPGCFAVNLNLAGRQRQGVVSPGEAPRLLAEVAELALEVRAPDTGRKVFREAVPGPLAYPGPMSGRGPDLLLVPADEGVLPVPNPVRDLWRPSEQTGMHRHAGMWVYRAPGVPTGRLSSPAALHDLVPTALHRLGIRYPADAHGRPLPFALENGPDPLPFLVENTRTPRASRDTPGNAGDDDLTIKSLTAMGYL